jgi:uncharacterized metal-binding protein YceD (DUF177 family)
MSHRPKDPAVFRVADLPQNAETPFDIRPDAADCAALAQELDLLGLRKLRLNGTIRAVGKSDWRVTGMLGATVVQTCVVTLEPVTTRIDHPVERLFLQHFEDPEPESETEIPEDENADPLGEVIDVGAILAEALAMHLPLYPRARDAELKENVFTEPGKQAMTDEDTKPFAGLSALRDKLAGEQEN